MLEHEFIVKADDLAWHAPTEPWLYFISICRKFGIVPSIGVVSSGLARMPKRQRDLFRSLYEDGKIELWDHSFAHPDFCHLSAVDAQAEVSRSCEAIASWLGAALPIFGFPFNKNNDELLRAVEETQLYEAIYFAGSQGIKSISRNFLFQPELATASRRPMARGIFLSRLKEHLGPKVVQVHPAFWAAECFSVFESLLAELIARDGKPTTATATTRVGRGPGAASPPAPQPAREPWLLRWPAADTADLLYRFGLTDLIGTTLVQHGAVPGLPEGYVCDPAAGRQVILADTEALDVGTPSDGSAIRQLSLSALTRSGICAEHAVVLLATTSQLEATLDQVSGALAVPSGLLLLCPRRNVMEAACDRAAQTDAATAEKLALQLLLTHVAQTGLAPEAEVHLGELHVFDAVELCGFQVLVRDEDLPGSLGLPDHGLYYAVRTRETAVEKASTSQGDLNTLWNAGCWRRYQRRIFVNPGLLANRWNLWRLTIAYQGDDPLTADPGTTEAAARLVLPVALRMPSHRLRRSVSAGRGGQRHLLCHSARPAGRRLRSDVASAAGKRPGSGARPYSIAAGGVSGGRAIAADPHSLRQRNMMCPAYFSMATLKANTSASELPGCMASTNS